MALLLLLGATVLAIYKPFGPTPFGAKLAIGHPLADTEAISVTRTRLWLYIGAAAVGLGILLLVLHQVVGSQMHH